MQVFTPFAEARKVTLIPEFAEGSPYLRGSEAAIESIVTNLVTNSLRAISKATPGEHKVVVSTTVLSDSMRIECLDTGTGIQEISTDDIWNPGETTYLEGTGFGLTIVRDTVLDLGGKVSAESNCELGGARITISLPILGR